MFGATNASSQTFNSSAQFTATAPSGTGTVDITVGGSATLSADQFTYSNIPSISSVSPNVGPNAGGTSVLITGSKFTGVVSVYFGSTSAASYIFNSDTSITAVSPAGTTGTVDITVTNATGTNGTSSLDYFTYYPPPTVTGLSLSYGISGTVIVITGTQFTGMSGVKFGSASVTSPTLNSSIQITATAPTNSAGTYDITITTPGGISAISSADQFTYVTTPTVTGLSPTNGTTGTSITLTGTAFQGITSVKINSVSASFTVNSTTSITVTAPTNSTGTYHTTVSKCIRYFYNISYSSIYLCPSTSRLPRQCFNS